MIRFAVTVIPHASLFVGGYAEASGMSDADTAADHDGILLPGSTVKGALREAATRLVNGTGRGREVLERLFGEEGRQGLLRVGPLRPESGPGGKAPAASVRNHVSLERARHQAAPGLLFEHRVTAAGLGTRFTGELAAIEPLDEDERGLLTAAVGITDQIGAGRGRGLGLVELELCERPAAEQARGDDPIELPAGTTQVTLVLEALEPLHLAAVKDPGNFTPSKGHLDGSSVRGAVAAALAAAGSEEELEALLGGPDAVVFGDGHPGDPAAIPAPRTLREPKWGGEVSDDAVPLCAEALAGYAFERPPDTRYAKGGTYKPSKGGWTRVGLHRRTVVRAAREHSSGRAAEGLLYSLEVVEPFAVGAGGERQPLHFHVPISGRREQLQTVLRALGGGIAVGGDRNRGFGRLHFVKAILERSLADLADRHRRWAERVGSLGVPNPESTGVLLAAGPLALDQRRLIAALSAVGLDLVEGVARRQVHGGWNAAIGLPRTVSGHFLPGSVFVVARRDGASALDTLRDLEARGLGPGRPDGWGRLVACHPIHLDCWKES